MTPVLFISYTLMDEKEAEARPLMGTIFLVPLKSNRYGHGWDGRGWDFEDIHDHG